MSPDSQIVFDPDQAYQQRAIEAVVRLFEGQHLAPTMFEIPAEQPGAIFTDTGVGNFLELTEEALVDNLRLIQKEHDIPEGARLPAGETIESLDFSVEMETGTGKTYVYLRTLFELHRVYGLSKFVIVVPSVPIREGVLSNLRLLSDHLRDLYDGVAFTHLVYDSKRLSDLRAFAQSTNLSILVMNIDAFNKDTNKIHQSQDQMMGTTPIELLQSTNPVVVLDEPQNMESEKSKAAIASLNPLLTLRYSATHRNRYNLVHRLTPADALAENLVKQIEVWSVLEDEDFNKPNIELVSVTASKRGVSAKIKIDVQDGAATKSKTITVKGSGEDLFEASGGRSVYDGYQVEEVNAADETVDFSNGETIHAGVRYGPDREAIQKSQIQTAVREHLDKELDVHKRAATGDLPAPMKVLSLFFIDRVANYVGDNAKFRRWFAEAYEELAKAKKYETLNLPAVDEVHGGYFAETRKGEAKDSRTGTSQDDARAYELIMRAKDQLILGDEPLRFIWSHSALREGWDNPNVFVITTLADSRSEIKKRQEIGRGLRLPVMKSGDRCQDPNVNRLTVVANEAYDDFASALQTEIEAETGTTFKKSNTKDRRARKTVRLRDGVLDDPDFKALWNAIQRRTRYRVTYDGAKVVERASSTLTAAAASLTPPRIRTVRARIGVDNEEGVSATVVTERAPQHIADGGYPIPDLLGHLARSLPVSRSLIRKVLVGSGRLGQARVNPQKFIDLAHEAIEQALMEELAAGITYEKVGGTGADSVYAMSLLQENELTSYLSNLVTDVTTSAYEDVIVDSDVERSFAEAISKREDVKVFVKLPWWFKVATPLGPYNPDWALVKSDGDGVDRAYLVRETKGTDDLTDLRPDERLKILFGERHFSSIGVNFGWLKDATAL